MKMVVGFAYNNVGALVMILKRKPEVLAGKWNGVGGKIETYDESIEHAMSREFEEEAGQLILPEQWRHCGCMYTRMGTVYVLTTTVPLLLVETKTIEEIKVFTPYDQQYLGSAAFPCMPNIVPLILLTKMAPHQDAIPYFTLDYLPGRMHDTI